MSGRRQFGRPPGSGDDGILFDCPKECEEGVIAYEDCGVKLTVPYHVKDLEGGGHPLAGDKVGVLHKAPGLC